MNRIVAKSKKGNNFAGINTSLSLIPINTPILLVKHNLKFRYTFSHGLNQTNSFYFFRTK